MPNDFLNISEATLWDNLKRKANETMRKINNQDDGGRRLKYFNPVTDSKAIPKLLEDIGKQFYKLFLYHSINKQLNENAEADIENLIHNFRFYFWPGYTTLDNKRIFINGAQRGEFKTQRYFTGIGNNPNTIYSTSLKEELNVFLTDTNHVVSFGGYNSSFWVKNIPSVVAFDNILNQKYLDDDLNGSDFNVASTHYWKSSQKILGENDKLEFIPMPLEKDGSELRILHVKVGNQGISYSPNRITIEVPQNRFNESGEIVENALAVENIEVDWVKEYHKKNYIQWPKQFQDKTGRNSESIDRNKSNETKLQVLSYTYWLSESLGNKKFRNQNYVTIKNEFSKNGYEEIAQRIKPFNAYRNEYHQKSDLCEVYYDNWYTTFLESYSDDVDLGTAMFLTSEEYDSEFLMKCSNWLRWIYNELRIVEATAKEEIQTENSILKLLKHTQKHYLNALESSLSSLDFKQQAVGNIATLSTSILKGHFDILELLAVVNDDNREELPEEPTEFSVTETINDHISILYEITRQESFYTILKNILPCDKETYQSKVPRLLKSAYQSEEYTLCSYQNILTIILKELLVNALENINVTNPHLAINVKQAEGNTIIEIENSISDFTFKKVMRNYAALKNKERISNRFGWWVISRLSKITNFAIEIDDLKNIDLTKVFKIKIEIENEEN
ncbi:MAG: hypothetical protein Aureis2KO_05510 [Aureisphaera sp.]